MNFRLIYPTFVLMLMYPAGRVNNYNATAFSFLNSKNHKRFLSKTDKKINEKSVLKAVYHIDLRYSYKLISKK